MVSRIKRVRRTITTKGPSRAELDKMRISLQTIANLRSAAERMMKQAAGEEADLFVAMVNAKLDHLDGFPEGSPNLDGPMAVADITQSPGKGQNFIDPRKFRAAVKDDKAFYSAITVGVTKAKDILSGKELERITVFTPGKLGEKKLKITVTGEE